MNDNKQPRYFLHTSGTKKKDSMAKLHAEIEAAGDSDDNNDNKQPPVRYFWYAEDWKKEDDMVKTAATDDAVEDDNPNQDSIIGRVNTGEIKRRRRRSCNSCGKSLTCRSSLCRHHKTCNKIAFKAVQSSKSVLKRRSCHL